MPSRQSSTEEASKKPPRGKVSIHINGTRYFISSPIAGAELRTLGQIPPDNQLFLECPGPDPDILIDPATTYDVKPGSQFYDLPRGTVGSGSGSGEQLAYATERLPSSSVTTGPDGLPILRWRGHLPEGWSSRELDLLIVVPPAYPAQAPAGFDVAGGVTLGETSPSGTGVRDLGGAPALHFCWNPSSQIDYTALDGLWRFAKFAETRFFHLA
jgi:hypothetical protein